MEKMNFLFLERNIKMVRVDVQPDCFLKKRAQGKVVIPGEIVNGSTVLNKQFEFMEYREVDRTDCMPVFNPEIKEVADNEQV